MVKRILIFSFIVGLTSCSVMKPEPLTLNQRYQIAQSDIQLLIAPQQDVPTRIDYYTALARSLKYNLDYRIKLANTALQAGQLEVAAFTMFPQLNVSGSLYTRDNQLSSFGITSTGQPTDVLNATPRTLRSARVAFTWNLLDFGLSYVKAKQQGERLLIAQEEARKQEQTLAQNVLTAYWEAYNAQQLMIETKEFQLLLNQAKKRLTRALKDPIIPKEEILEYQGALLEGEKKISELEFRYHKTMIDLAHLMNLPPDQQFILERPPVVPNNIKNIKTLNFQKLDAITLVSRPELRGQEYQRRIAEFGISAAILQALPGITLNDGWNYNSNQFLINDRWMDRSIDLAWNLINLASLPSTLSAAKLQVNYEKLKRMALTMGVLTETRYAFWHYKTLNDEYDLAHKQTINARALYQYNRTRRMASLGSTQKVILAKLHLLATEMDEQLIVSDLSKALGELFLSIGTDILPMDVGNESVPELTLRIKENFILSKTYNFNNYINETYAHIFPCLLPVAAHPCVKKQAHVI